MRTLRQLLTTAAVAAALVIAKPGGPAPQVEIVPHKACCAAPQAPARIVPGKRAGAVWPIGRAL